MSKHIAPVQKSHLSQPWSLRSFLPRCVCSELCCRVLSILTTPRLPRPRYVELRPPQNLHHTIPATRPRSSAQPRLSHHVRERDVWTRLTESTIRALVLRPTPPACSVSSRSTRDSLAVPLPSTSLLASSRDTSTATSTARTLRPCVRLPPSVYLCSGLELT
jgi:hypothetical protein